LSDDTSKSPLALWFTAHDSQTRVCAHYDTLRKPAPFDFVFEVKSHDPKRKAVPDEDEKEKANE